MTTHVEPKSVTANERCRTRNPIESSTPSDDRAKQERQDFINGIAATLRASAEAAAASRTTFFREISKRAKFHRYRGGNPLLILMQKPNATFVGSKADWEKRGYVPLPGTEIIILVPFKYEVWFLDGKRRVDIEKKLRALPKGQRPTFRDRLLNRGYKVEERVKFNYGNTYDISDVVKIGTDITDPIAVERNRPPRPAPPALSAEIKLLEGEGKPLIMVFVERALVDFGYTLTFESLSRPGLNGYATIRGQEPVDKVVIRADNEPAQQQKTALHEFAHVALGHVESSHAYALHRQQMEIEAEGLAYVLAGVLGLDTTPYSFGYVDHWSTNRWLNEGGSTDLDVVKGAFRTIDRVAAQLFERYFEFDPLDPASKLGEEVDAEHVGALRTEFLIRHPEVDSEPYLVL